MFHILLTGATGFLGASLLPLLQEDERVSSIHLLIRPHSVTKAKAELKKFNKVKIIKGDITKADVFFEESDRTILKEINVMIHLAAFYDLTASYAECFLQNVVGTQNILQLCRQCPLLLQFHYASTIAVAGNHAGEFGEDQLDVGQTFSDAYSKTKFQAEKLVHEELKNIYFPRSCQVKIYRLGILVGEHDTGRFVHVNGPYYFLRYLAGLEKLRPVLTSLPLIPLPFNESSEFPLIPVDCAAQIIKLGFDSGNNLPQPRVYHVTLQNGVTVGSFLRDALQYFGLKIKLVPIVENRMNKYLLKGLKIPPALLSYVYAKVKFKRDNLVQDFPYARELSYKNFRDAFYGTAYKKFQG